LGSKSFDLAVDKILIKFVDNLLGDLQTADKKTTPDYGSYVDRYGKEFPGSLTFNEVKEIYMAHVHFTEMTIRKQAPPDDNLLRALYNTPLPAFQTIMSDYDLPILESEKQLLKDQGFVKLDHNKNEQVEYKGIFQK